MSKKNIFIWPKSIKHIREPYLALSDEIVTIGEISGERRSEYEGYRQLFSALIPFSELSKVLKNPGGIGYEVESYGPRPLSGIAFERDFWVRGISEDIKYEPLINYWLHHNKSVILPSNSILMCYGLVPRYLKKDNIVCWDDPREPVYDVLRVRALSEYTNPNEHTLAQITIRRDYLEDFLMLKQCALVGVYYEERYSYNENRFNRMLGKRKSEEFIIPGNRLVLLRVNPKHHKGADQKTRIWGCVLILKPKGFPISKETITKWPFPIKKSFPLEEIFVRDDVLKEFEGKEEIDINPELGCVSNNGWWATTHCRRVGRSHIAIEYNKLREGTPAHVFNHYSRYAAKKNEAKQDEMENKGRNVGSRSREIVFAYLDLLECLAKLSGFLNLFLEGKDIGGLEKTEINYKGWWMLEVLKPLGYVISLEMNKEEFLSRCKDIYKATFEQLEEKTLRQILSVLGVDKTLLGEYKSLKLTSILAQLCIRSKERGLNIISNSRLLINEIDLNVQLKVVTPLFALYELRQFDSHFTGSSFSKKFQLTIEELGIDREETKQGWGKALDKVYDTIANSIKEICGLINTAMSIK